MHENKFEDEEYWVTSPRNLHIYKNNPPPVEITVRKPVLGWVNVTHAWAKGYRQGWGGGWGGGVGRSHSSGLTVPTPHTPVHSSSHAPPLLPLWL
jgi:hypothetical protein